MNRGIACIAALLLCCLWQTAGAQDAGADVNALRAYDYGGDEAPLGRIEGYAAEAVRTGGEPRETLARELAAVLGSESSYAAKQFACRQLVLVGGEAEIPALTPLLADETLAHGALLALTAIGGDSVVKILLDALPASGGRIRLGLIGALGELGAREAGPSLATLLDSAEADVASAAAAALARMPAGAGADALVTAFRASGGRAAEFRADLADRCLEAAEGLAARPADVVRAAAVFRLLLDEAPSVAVRAGALGGLVRTVETAEAVTRSLEAMADPEPAVRRMAGRALRELPGGAVTERIAAVLAAPAGAPPAEILAILADRGDTAAEAAILPLCGAAEPTTAAAALGALGRLGSVRAVPLLTAGGAAADKAIADAAFASLCALRDPGVNAALLKQLDKGNAATKRVAIEALLARGAPNIGGALMAQVKAPDAALRSAALRALRDAGDASLFGPLLAEMGTLPASVRPEAERTAVALASRGGDAGAAMAALEPLIAGTADAEAGLSYLRIAGRLGGDRAFAVLTERLATPGPMRVEAIRLLGDFEGERSLPVLTEILRSSPDAIERALAFRGVVRMATADPYRNPDDRLKQLAAAGEATDDASSAALLLSGLARLGTPAALDLAVEYLANPELRDEAEAAVLALVRQTAGYDPKRAIEILNRLVRETARDAVREQAQALLAVIGGFESYVTTWEVSELYLQEGKICSDLFGIAFPPEEPPTGENARWRLMPAGTDPATPWLMDLLGLFGGEQRVAYLRTKVWSDRDRSLKLALGSDDGVKVWLNGDLLLELNIQRGVAPGQDTVDVSLRQGWNMLVIKVTQNIMGWGLVAEFREADGRVPDDICFDVDSAGRPARVAKEELDLLTGYLDVWQVAGPYTQEGMQGSQYYDTEFPPETEGEVAWQDIRTGGSADRPWLVDIRKVFDLDHAVAYLRTELVADADRDVVLELGSDDGIKVWVNGEFVHGNNAVRGIAPGQEKPAIRLKKGPNAVLLKITQHNQGWEACARLRTPDGRRVTGVVCRTPEP